MNNKRKGFSIAELLIALLIISIVLAAAIPAITKKNTAGSEKIWRWAGKNNSAYFGIGQNQSAIIGASSMPELDKYFNFESDENVELEEKNFKTDGDKLVLLKRNETTALESHDFENSHISFYTIDGDTNNDNNIHYAGRLALDRHNMALGIGSLQNINPIELSDDDTSFKGYNTAIGHYSLFNNRSGMQNTALGERALIWNNDGNGNTAVGYQSLAGSADGGGSPSNSTALGTFALQHNYGKYNTAVGANALRENEGEGNTAIGSNACNNLMGNYNICIGYNAGVVDKEDTESASQEDSYAFYLGTKSDMDENIAEAALLSGHTSQKAAAGIKDLLANVDKFEIRPAKGGNPVFEASPKADNGANSLGNFQFIFHNIGGTTGNSILRLQERCQAAGGSGGGVPTYDNDSCAGSNMAGDILFMAHDGGSTLRNMSFNDMFKIRFPVGLNPVANTVRFEISNSKLLKSEVQANFLELNNNLLIDRESDYKLNITKTDGFSLKGKNNKDSDPPLIQVLNGDVNINAANKTFIGNTTPAYVEIKPGLNIVNTKGDSNAIISLQNTGIINAKEIHLQDLSGFMGGQVAVAIMNLHSTASDIRLKNILGDSKAGLKEINSLEVKNYTYKSDKKKTPHVGVIAQQLQKVFPNSVIKDKDGYLRITKDEIFYAMINSIKELFAKIQDLTAKITGLDKRITELEKQNQQLKKQNAEFEKRLSKIEKKVK